MLNIQQVTTFIYLHHRNMSSNSILKPNRAFTFANNPRIITPYGTLAFRILLRSFKRRSRFQERDLPRNNSFTTGETVPVTHSRILCGHSSKGIEGYTLSTSIRVVQGPVLKRCVSRGYLELGDMLDQTMESLLYASERATVFFKMFEGPSNVFAPDAAAGEFRMTAEVQAPRLHTEEREQHEYRWSIFPDGNSGREAYARKAITRKSYREGKRRDALFGRVNHIISFTSILRKR
ncbi:hypothetical protein BDZ89DRAFT_1201999 [Hymenopellis radicata]|nr:hypothetical protein BDZ89DRAFT_1201999 [Hymenopellis radicata]